MWIKIVTVENTENKIESTSNKTHEKENFFLDPLIFSYFAGTEKFSKFLTKNEFYKFYNTILDCLPVFYENSLQKIKDSTEAHSNSAREDELCCICEDKKSDVMLECCVRLDILNLAFLL
jgi:hypothetical protein